MPTASLFWGLLLGSVGLGYLFYGRRQRSLVPVVCGLALMVIPYVVSNTVLLVLLGAALAVGPFIPRP